MITWTGEGLARLLSALVDLELLHIRPVVQLFVQYYGYYSSKKVAVDTSTNISKMDDDVRDIFEVEKLLTDSVPQPLTKDAILHPQKVTHSVAFVWS